MRRKGSSDFRCWQDGCLLKAGTSLEHILIDILFGGLVFWWFGCLVVWSSCLLNDQTTNLPNDDVSFNSDLLAVLHIDALGQFTICGFSIIDFAASQVVDAVVAVER